MVSEARRTANRLHLLVCTLRYLADQFVISEKDIFIYLPSNPLSPTQLKILQIFNMINSTLSVLLNQICRCVIHLSFVMFSFLIFVWKVKLVTFMIIFVSISDSAVLDKFKYVISTIIMSSLYRCSPTTTTSQVQ